MDTSDEERSLFKHVTCNMSAAVNEVNNPGALALDLIEQVLQALKPCRTELNFSRIRQLNDCLRVFSVRPERKFRDSIN